MNLLRFKNLINNHEITDLNERRSTKSYQIEREDSAQDPGTVLVSQLEVVNGL